MTQNIHSFAATATMLGQTYERLYYLHNTKKLPNVGHRVGRITVFTDDDVERLRQFLAEYDGKKKAPC